MDNEISSLGKIILEKTHLFANFFRKFEQSRLSLIKFNDDLIKLHARLNRLNRLENLRQLQRKSKETLRLKKKLRLLRQKISQKKPGATNSSIEIESDFDQCRRNGIWVGCKIISHVLDIYVIVVFDDDPTRKEVLVHKSRMKSVCESVCESVCDASCVGKPSQEKFDVEKFTKLDRNDDGEWIVEVHWKGFDYTERTWEKVEYMKQDVPFLLLMFLRKHLPEEDCRKIYGEELREIVG